MFSDLPRIFSQTGVELRLSAAGLVGREFHVNAEAVENLDDGFTRFGKE